MFPVSFHLFTTLNIPEGMNLSLVMLIPKTANSIRITDFHPIVMGNFSYKIFTKIIDLCLGHFIGNTFSPSQYGFILGRKIHTCIAIASKTINSLRMGTKDSMAIKVDITKAFDTVSWEFLSQVLSCMGFSVRFCNMVTGILSSARLSILINDSPNGYFSYSRGVCQGDPLSPPPLFCLAEEALIKWLDFAIDSRNITVHKKLPCHVIYADDIMIFLEASRSNGRHIKQLLKNYGNISSQRFSPPKSSIYFAPTTLAIIRDYILGYTSISQGSPPFNYLGVPIFRGTPKVKHVAPIADSILTIFARWRGH